MHGFHRGAETPHLIFALGGFEKDDIRAVFLEIAAAGERLLEAVHRPRVGARHDQDVDAGARIHRGPDLHSRLLAGNHLLAAGMTAFLRADLVLNHHAGRAGAGYSATVR